ncbi:MAG: hypothetical protein LBM96_07885 [Methanobrevibacter sp.]|jgi:hypothetical protein|nr:hypothetical protein [Candidatus Methanoflexus mossambicus]
MGLGVKQEIVYQLFYYFMRLPYIISHRPHVNILSTIISTIFLLFIISGILVTIYNFISKIKNDKTQIKLNKISNIPKNIKISKNKKFYTMV